MNKSGSIPIDCGDFLRGCLSQVCNNSAKFNLNSDEVQDLKNEPRIKHGADTYKNKGQNVFNLSNDNEDKNCVNQKKDIKSLFYISLEWKFECTSCHRYIVTSMKVREMLL